MIVYFAWKRVVYVYVLDMYVMCMLSAYELYISPHLQLGEEGEEDYEEDWQAAERSLLTPSVG